MIIVIIVFVIVGGVYMFKSSSHEDTNQVAKSEDYDTQTYHIRSKPIKLDANKETKQQEMKSEQNVHAMKESRSLTKSLSGISEGTPSNSTSLQVPPSTPSAPPDVKESNVNELIPFKRSSSTPLQVPPQAPPQAPPLNSEESENA